MDVFPNIVQFEYAKTDVGFDFEFVLDSEIFETTKSENLEPSQKTKNAHICLENLYQLKAVIVFSKHAKFHDSCFTNKTRRARESWQFSTLKGSGLLKLGKSRQAGGTGFPRQEAS